MTIVCPMLVVNNSILDCKRVDSKIHNPCQCHRGLYINNWKLINMLDEEPNNTRPRCPSFYNGIDTSSMIPAQTSETTGVAHHNATPTDGHLHDKLMSSIWGHYFMTILQNKHWNRNIVNSSSFAFILSCVSFYFLEIGFEGSTIFRS